MSRREFLKLLGYGAAAVTLAPLLNFKNVLDLKGLAPLPASAQSSGSWALGQNTTAVAIHAAVLPSGKIFYLAGSGYHRDRPNGPFDARIVDLGSGSEINLPLSQDLFCIGITHLANGNVLLGGGTLMYDTNPDSCNGKWHGLNATYEVNWQAETLSSVATMAAGRWYPSLVALPSGKAVIFNGMDQYGAFNLLVEIYDPDSHTWTIKLDPNRSTIYCVGGGETACAGSGSPCFGGSGAGASPNIGTYPRMHLMPSGLVAVCGGQAQVRSWDPSTSRWANIGLTSTARSYGTSFLLPLHNTASERGKILIQGGSPTSDTFGTTVVEIIDFDQGTSTNPVIRQTASVTYRRRVHAPVILPNGKCVVFGGSEQGNTIPVYNPEMFDPVSETWQTLPAATVARVYHQVSLLLPDGRVWTAGSTVRSGTEELRTEFFSPSYLFQGPRPVISAAPNVGGYGGTINIPTPDAAGVGSVSLVRLMSCTHHYEANQRLVWLQIVSRGSGDITVSAPINANVAPPGYYMIHVLNGSGVPSTAKIIQIPGTGTGTGGDTTPPAQVAGLTVTPISSSRLDLSWTANSDPDLNHYNVYRGTTAGFPVNPATDTPLSQPTTNSYSNTGLSEATTYYYKVAAVDNSGNIGGFSNEISGTTLDSTAPSKVAGLAVTPISGSRLDLSWTANTEPDLNHYNVYRGTTAGFPVNPATDTPLSQPTAHSYSDTGLSQFTTYYYKVAAVDNSGNIGILSDEASATTGDSAAPAKVFGLAVTPVSSSRLDLSWTANTEPDLNHYNVYRGTTAGFPVNPATDTPLAQSIPNSYSDTSGLTGSTTYYYKIAAVSNSGNIGILSDEGSGTTSAASDTTAPSKVAGLIVTPFSSSQLNLSWTANTELDLARYNVYRGATPGFPVNTSTDTPLAQPTTNSYSDIGLTASTTYYYKVAAVDTSGNIGILSDEASGTTTASETFYDVPIPGNKAVAINTGGSIRYGEEALTASSILVGKSLKSWKVRLRKSGTPSGLVTAKVRRKSNDSIAAAFNESIDSTTLGTAFAEYTFTLSTPYIIQSGDRILIEYNGPTSVQLEQWTVDKIDGSNTRRVRYDGTSYIGGNAEDVSGTMSSTAPGGGDTTPPSKVVGLSVTPASNSQLDLAWTANTETDLARYKIYRGTTPGFAVNTSTDTPLAQPTINSYSDVGLTASTTYYYKVAAVDTSGNIGLLSDEGSGTTNSAPDTTPPSKVLSLSVTPFSSSQLNLSWTANTELDLARYNVYRGTTAGFPVNTSTDTPLAQPTTNSYSDTGLTASTTYYYKVAAVDTSGNIGILSDEMSGTTTGSGIFYDVPIPGNTAAAVNSGVSIRYGEEAQTASSILIGKSLKSWKVRLRKSGTPSGLVTAKVRRKSDDSVVATFSESIDSTTLGTAFAEYTFTLTTAYTIQSGDRIMIEYSGPAAVNVEIWNVDKIDSSNTRRIRYSGTSYVGGNTEDVTGTMSSS